MSDGEEGENKGGEAISNHEVAYSLFGEKANEGGGVKEKVILAPRHR